MLILVAKYTKHPLTSMPAMQTSTTSIHYLYHTMSSSSKQNLPSTFTAAKKRRSSASAAETTAKKRQKLQESQKAIANACLEARIADWVAKCDEVGDLRKQLSEQNLDPLDKLHSMWDLARRLDQRKALSPADKEAVPAIPALHNLLHSFFTCPLTWIPAEHQSQAVKQKHDTLEESDLDDDDTTVRFYVRRLVFPDHASLKSLLENVLADAPQYSGHINILVTASKNLGGDTGKRALSYGGYTIANSPYGRQEDDEEAARVHAGSLLKLVLDEYDDKVEVYELPALAFQIGEGGVSSILLSRNDPRTSLFESVVIDTFGLLCLNTAPPGMKIQFKLDDEELRIKSLVDGY